MFTAELRFDILPKTKEEDWDDAIYLLLGSLRQNGQILGKELRYVQVEGSIRSFVHLPAIDALAAVHNNKYVEKSLLALSEAALSQPTVHVFEAGAAEQRQSEPAQSYILFTNYITIHSPLRSGVDFQPLPLYMIPPTYDRSEYYDILAWQSDYQACDTLQMNCQTGERWATRQMSDVHSSLSVRGRKICGLITASTTLPTYYYLHRYKTHTTWKKEIKRKCPDCGGEWLLNERWHIFDFRCDDCRLVSNISWGTY